MSHLIFEHPLNERIRFFLRLEHLFEKIHFFQRGDDPWETRSAIEGLLELALLSGRSDLKNELLKELDRIFAVLARVRDQPGVDREALERILSKLEQAAEKLRGLSNHLGQGLRENEFLKSIAQRSTIPGGTCGFDLPQFHHWLAQPLDQRQAQIGSWLQELEPVQEAIQLILSLIRTSSRARQVQAKEGFFQETLDAQLPAQLLQVRLPDGVDLFPEISGHKNRFCIRFLRYDQLEKRPVPLQEDLDFSLTCCIF